MKKMLDKNMNFSEETVTTWCELIAIEEKHRSNFDEKGKETEWIFRGVTKEGYPLLTTLERDIGNIEGIDPNKETDKLRECLKRGLNGLSINEIESGLLRKFKRQYHHYGTMIPEEDNVTEWLALMRHYGSPSRLLDWTYSFYVAVFFALEQAISDCAVWALEKCSIKNNLPNDINRVIEINEDEDIERCETWINAFKRENSTPFVYPVNPLRLNERIVTQQSDFLCPGDLSVPFEDNLAAVLPYNEKENDWKLFKYIIKCDVKERKKILLNLHRMNINRASLFPGLGGFATSLKTLLVSPKNLIKPDRDCKDKDSI